MRGNTSWVVASEILWWNLEQEQIMTIHDLWVGRCVCVCVCVFKQAHYLHQRHEAGIKKNIQMWQEWVIDDHNCDYKA